MENNAPLFSKDLADLLMLAASKKKVLDYQEIDEAFHDVKLTADEMEKLLDFLEACGIDVLRMEEPSAEVDDQMLLLKDDDDVDDEENKDQNGSPAPAR